MWNEFKIDPGQLKAFQEDRQACVADYRLAQRMKWKIGERIPLQGTFYTFHLDLKLVGTFDAPQNTDSLWFNWYYLDEGLKSKLDPGAGNAGTIFAKIDDGIEMATICKSIDDRFANSDTPTRSQSETAFAKMFAEMLGNIQLYILAIGSVVVFALTLVAASGMAMSMRERTTEIAVLTAIGFSRQKILLFVLGESCWIAILGGVVGIALGCGCLQAMHRLAPQVIPISMVDLAGPWLGMMLLLAAVIGLVSGLIPAVRASQLSVVDGLRRVI